jgi:hypothetical protein
MQHIETVTVGSGGAASITFSAIPADYTDLVVVLSMRSSGAFTGGGFTIRFNGTNTGYSQRRLRGDGSSVASDTSTDALWLNGSNATANTFSNVSIYIPNYRSSVAKSYSNDGVAENNATLGFGAIVAGLWTGTDPITSITVTPESGSFLEHTSASLYGITAGSDGIVAVS